MDRELASAVSTKKFGPPRCQWCDRLLVTAGVDRYVCPCCGELYVFIEKLLGIDAPDGNGCVRTNMTMNKAGHLTEMSPNHLHEQPKRRRKVRQTETLFGS